MVIDRYVAKHPLLKPELIVVNDQVHGFKKIKTRLKSLEEYPIYFECEYQKEDDELILETLELYAEAQLESDRRIRDIKYLANTYASTINVDIVQQINKPEHQSIVISSRLNDELLERFSSDDEGMNAIQEQDLILLIEVSFLSFINFIKLLDDVLVKGKSLDAINHILRHIPREKDDV